MATIIDGKEVATFAIAEVTKKAERLHRKAGVKPGLAVVIVGADPASHAYLDSKSKMAKQCGFKLVAGLNADPAVQGFLVQLPLPKHLNAEPVILSVCPEKDVDGLHVVNAGKIATGDLATDLISCTPAGVMLLVKLIHGEDPSRLNAVVIGRSNLFGKLMGLLLLPVNATVTMAHSKTKNLASVCRNADILVAAMGRPQMVKAHWVKPGATVIDVGINRIPSPDKGEGKSRLVGDVAYDEASEIAGAITPVPGGVGPMTIAMLMANTMTAAYRAIWSHQRISRSGRTVRRDTVGRSRRDPYQFIETRCLGLKC